MNGDTAEWLSSLTYLRTDAAGSVMARKTSYSEEETGRELYAQDGSVDLKGNPVLRTKRGGWKACSFIVVYELFERMAYFGITSNLVLYLTRKLHMGTVDAANNVTNWVGAAFLTPILGAYVADAHLGRYWTFVVASAVYLLGMCLLTLVVSIRTLKPPACNQENAVHCPNASTQQLGVFFAALYILALGNGGTKPNISTIGADQFDDFHPKERAQKLSFFNWWMSSVFLGTLFANTALVYIQDNVGWTLGYGLPTFGLAISIAIFLTGTPVYRHKLPQGSPFTKMARVIVAAVRKWRVPVPDDSKKLHELDLDEYLKKGKFRIHSTPSLGFLNKAAVKSGPATPWMLTTVTQVEETKQMLRLIPIWCAMFIPSILFAQVTTLFVKQGTTLDRSIGPQFQIPPASLGAFVTIAMLVSVVLYDRYFVKFMRMRTNNPRGITLLQRIGIGQIIDVVAMMTAALTERRRLRVARVHGLVDNAGKVPLSIFTLLPQFMLVGLADSFTAVGKIEFFYDQAPEGMKSLGSSYTLSTLAMGNFLSSFLLSTVDKITRRHGGKGWIMNNLNSSHLDYYYGLLTVLIALNFVFFLAVSRLYEYRAEVFESVDAHSPEEAAAGMKMNEVAAPQQWSGS